MLYTNIFFHLTSHNTKFLNQLICFSCFFIFMYLILNITLILNFNKVYKPQTIHLNVTAV